MGIIIRSLFPTILLFSFIPLHASVTSGENTMVGKMTLLVFQVAIIIFAAKFLGELFGKLKLPKVLGELCAGIIIGPYLLGSFPLPGFSNGLFPVVAGSMPISTELYGMATFASIILLFLAGLETDIEMF